MAWVWLAALAASAGCGGSSSPAASSGVPADKKIASLADGEIRKLCEWSNTVSDTGLSDEEICTYNALLANSSVECEQKRDTCLKEMQSGAGPGLLGVRTQDCSHKTGKSVPSGCKATVAALEQCHRDLIDAMVEDAMRASCSSVGMIWTRVPSTCPEDVLVCSQLITDED